MSIPKRNADANEIVAGERTFFVTSSTSQKRPILQTDRAAQLLVRILYELRVERRYLLHAFVVMPDHFHVVVTVGSEMSIERAVQFIKGRFAFRAGHELQFRAPVWERGFSETRIQDEEALDRTRQYIHANPVRRGLCDRLQEFAYSSANPMFKLDAAPQGLKPVSLAASRHG